MVQQQNNKKASAAISGDNGQLLYRRGARCVGHVEQLSDRPLPPSCCWAASLLCECTARPEEPTNPQLSESALMHGSACVTVSLKKPTHVLLLFTVCPCGMNKRCASWWAEQCQWRNRWWGLQKTWMASQAAEDVITLQPVIMITARLTSGLQAVTPLQTVPVRSPTWWGINSICMLTNEDVM